MLYVFRKSMEKVTYVWKIKLASTMIYADSVSFFTSTDDRIQKYFVDVSGFPCLDKSKGEFSIVYKKNECSAMV